MKQQLARFLYPHGSTRRVLRGPAKGMKLVVEPGVGFSYMMGLDAAAPAFFMTAIARGMRVFDVGANKGQMALLFAAVVGCDGQVIALEPAPAEFASLERNVRLNHLRNVTTLQVAAAEANGEATFLYAPSTPTQGKLAAVESSYAIRDPEALNVRTRTLDSVAEEFGAPDVVKIDVEGSAATVLRGARQLIDTHAPKFYVELHGPEEQAGVRDELIARGYIARTLPGDIVKDPTAGWFSPLWCARPVPTRA